ncbi:hypothetical protein LSAT2_015136 [Lamellibrachia satsuma]|nr:hypothetical protein LSAT2_015136 [Lamellibrachia satsuma]
MSLSSSYRQQKSLWRFVVERAALLASNMSAFRVPVCSVLLVLVLLSTSSARPKPPKTSHDNVHHNEQRLSRLIPPPASLWAPPVDKGACKMVTDFWNRKCCTPSFDRQPCKCSEREGGLGFC